MLEGGFEVGDLEIGPDVVDVAAEGAVGTALGGGNPKPRSASESLPIVNHERGKRQHLTDEAYMHYLADARRRVVWEAGVGASSYDCSN